MQGEKTKKQIFVSEVSNYVTEIGVVKSFLDDLMRTLDFFPYFCHNNSCKRIKQSKSNIHPSQLITIAAWSGVLLTFEDNCRKTKMELKLVEEISRDMSLDKDALIEKGVKAFLKEKKRKLKLEMLGILARYKVSSGKELEEKIKVGEIEEHPTWEDLIVLENLEAVLKKVDGYLRNLPKTSSNSN